MCHTSIQKPTAAKIIRCRPLGRAEYNTKDIAEFIYKIDQTRDTTLRTALEWDGHFLGSRELVFQLSEARGAKDYTSSSLTEPIMTLINYGHQRCWISCPIARNLDLAIDHTAATFQVDDQASPPGQLHVLTLLTEHLQLPASGPPLRVSEASVVDMQGIPWRHLVFQCCPRIRNAPPPYDSHRF